MSRTARDGDVVRDLLSVADLLEEPQLARLYACFHREGPATVKEAMAALDLPQGTAYSYVNRLHEAGVLAAVTEEQPREYETVEILESDELRHGFRSDFGASAVSESTVADLREYLSVQIDCLS